MCIFISIYNQRAGASVVEWVRWILLWIMPLVQDWSIDLVISSPASYHCTTNASPPRFAYTNLLCLSPYSNPLDHFVSQHHPSLLISHRSDHWICSLDLTATNRPSFFSRPFYRVRDGKTLQSRSRDFLPHSRPNSPDDTSALITKSLPNHEPTYISLDQCSSSFPNGIFQLL